MAVFVSPSWVTAQPSDTNELVSKVARLYGLQGDTEAQAIALSFLDDAVKELNQTLWEFNAVTQTGIALVASQQEYDLAAPFYKEKQAYLVETASPNREHEPMNYLDWVTFKRLYGNAPGDNPGAVEPVVYSVFNQQTEGKVALGPVPSASDATAHTLTIEYYRRIPLPSASNQLSVPQEVENALLYSAQKRFALHIAGPDAPDWASFQVLEDKAFTALRAVDRRHPDETTRFRMYDRRTNRGQNRGTGPLYLQIR